VIHAERNNVPFFVYRDRKGEQRIVGFDRARGQLTIGRSPTADVRIDWDDQVSALHAVIQRLAGELTLLDDGLSTNGSYINGHRVHGMRRLRERDSVRVGRTVLLVRNITDRERKTTVTASPAAFASGLSDQQRKVLAILCRPLRFANALAALPTNQEIADELFLSVPAVKLHLRALFDKFQIADLPQNKKRLALAQRALESGLLTNADFLPARPTA
jgi:pSer/pThr/pTyr-binding forkhead associated (FHA) protein